MKIKNISGRTIHFGYRGAKPGFKLENNQTSRDLPPAVAHDKYLRRDVDAGVVELILTDADYRFLGIKPEKKEKPAPAPAPPKAEVKVEEPAPVVEEPAIVEVKVEEPAPVVEEPAPEPEPVEEEPETPAFSLPKPPSKMTKADWLKVGMMPEVGLKNEIDITMTKTVLAEKVTNRLAEKGLI